MSQIIEEGNIYEINNFFINWNKPRYKIVPHVAMLRIARANVFKHVLEDMPEIPRQKFNFFEFHLISQRIDINYVLSGLFILLLIYL